MIEPLWWIRSAGVALASRSQDASRRSLDETDPPERLFLYPDKISILSARAKALLY